MQVALVAAVLLLPVVYLLSMPAVEYLLADQGGQISPGMQHLVGFLFYPAILCLEFLPQYPDIYEYEFEVLCRLFGVPPIFATLSDNDVSR